MTQYHRARLLAVAAAHSGDWLNAVPISACGLRLNDEAIRVAVGLRLGSENCQRIIASVVHRSTLVDPMHYPANEMQAAPSAITLSMI